MLLYARSLLFVYLVTLLGPAGIVLDFLLEQDRIARELCVQRAVPDAKRTCHGQCHMAKQLSAVEGSGEQERPQPPTCRYEIQFLEVRKDLPATQHAEATNSFGDARVATLSDGFPRMQDEVPWG